MQVHFQRKYSRLSIAISFVVASHSLPVIAQDFEVDSSVATVTEKVLEAGRAGDTARPSRDFDFEIVDAAPEQHKVPERDFDFDIDE